MAMLLAEMKANPDDVYCFVEEPLLPTRLPFLQSEDGHDDPLAGWRINVCFLFNATGTIMCPPLLIFRADDALAQGLETPPEFTVFVRHSVDGFVTPEVGDILLIPRPIFSEYLEALNGRSYSTDDHVIVLVTRDAHSSTDPSMMETTEHGFRVQNLSNLRIIHMQGPDAPRCIHPGMCGLVELWKTLYRSSYLRHLMMTPEWRDSALFRYAPPLSIMELGQLQYIIDEFARPGHTLMHATDYAHCEVTLLPPRVQRTMNDTPGAEDSREITLHTQPGPLLNDHRCRRRVARVVTEYLVRQALKLGINVRDAPEWFGASNALVRDNVSCAASALTTLSTEQECRKRKVKQELPRPRIVTSAGSGVRGVGEVPPPPSDDVVARLARPNYQLDFQTLALYGPHGVGCQLPAQDVLTLADGQCLADTVVDFHNMGHYSLVIATNLRTMVSGKLSETAEGGVELVHHDGAQLHTKRPEVMEGVKNLVCQSLDVCALMFRVCWQSEDIPQQSNVVDSGIYVGMYLHALVSSGFSILKEWMPFYGVKSWAYRRQLREEVSLHATGDLIVKLFGEGVDVPVQPLPQVGEHGALVFPKEDEVRTDLARQSGMITRVELGGYVVCAAVMGLARSLGISEDQLLSGAAHELQAHGTPLLALSTSKNHVEHAASMRTLGITIQSAPCPLPLPSFPSAHLDGSSIIHSEPTPADVKPVTTGEQELPTAPVTPAAPPTVSRSARYRTRAGTRNAARAVRQTSMPAAYGGRPASSRWTGVSWCPRGRKWGVKMVCGLGTGQQIRLGAYNVELDAAYAYVAATFVIRRNDHIQHTKELSDVKKASLIGCVRDDVRHLVKARMWWRWRQWRTAMAELGIAPSTPFPLENNGARSPDNSTGDGDVEGRMVHDVEAVDE
ncbi:unnamed protein product [Closterium sp. NIES-65]|nr:unnamed protein product [Closterium sp. NIES-65]